MSNVFDFNTARRQGEVDRPHLSPDGEFRAAALDYAMRGLPVFPCGRDKKPLIAGGFKNATMDEVQIRNWWTAHPTASIGSPTGPHGNGHVVVDVDLPEGPASLAELESELGPLPTTKEQKTGGGGRQLFYACPVGHVVKNSAGKIGKNLDVRGEGGYVILPPSGHPSGGRYQWINEGIAAQLPEAWVERMAYVEPKPVAQVPASAPKADGLPTPYGQRALEAEMGRVLVAPVGARNDALNVAGFALAQLVAGGEIPESIAWDSLTRAAIGSGLDAGETKKTLQSAFQAGAKEPRSAPPRDSAPRASENCPPHPAEEDELITFEEIYATDYVHDPIIIGLLDQKESLLITGRCGLGKSLLTLEMMLHLAMTKNVFDFNGLKLFGQFPVGKQYEVLLIQSENSAKATKRRLVKLAEGKPEYLSALKHIHTPKSHGDIRVTGVLNKQCFKDRIIRDIEASKADVVFIDPLISYHDGDENSNGEMRRSLDQLTEIMDLTGVAVVLVHHTGKGEGVEAIHSARGGSAIADWAANFLAMSLHEPEKANKRHQEAVSRGEKFKPIIKIDHPKARNFPTVPAFLLERDENLVLHPYATPVDKARLNTERAIRARIMAVVRANEASGEVPTSLTAFTKIYTARWNAEDGDKACSRGKVEAAIEAAVMEGELFKVQRLNPWNKKDMTCLATKPDPEPEVDPENTVSENGKRIKKSQRIDESTNPGESQKDLDSPEPKQGVETGKSQNRKSQKDPGRPGTRASRTNPEIQKSILTGGEVGLDSPLPPVSDKARDSQLGGKNLDHTPTVLTDDPVPTPTTYAPVVDL